MKIYTLLHTVPNDPLFGGEAIVTVYETKAEARAAMKKEIRKSVKWLRKQYAYQPDALECVEYEIGDDNGYYGDGIMCELWEIKEHKIAA